MKICNQPFDSKLCYVYDVFILPIASLSSKNYKKMVFMDKDCYCPFFYILSKGNENLKLKYLKTKKTFNPKILLSLALNLRYVTKVALV